VELIFLALLIVSGLIVIYLSLRQFVKSWFRNNSHLSTIQKEVEKVIVELNNTTARNIDLIETRVKELKELLTTVDKRISLLKREEEKHELSKTVYTAIINKSEAKAKESNGENSGPGLKERILNLYYAGFSSQAIAAKVGKTVGEVELIISLAEKSNFQ